MQPLGRRARHAPSADDAGVTMRRRLPVKLARRPPPWRDVRVLRFAFQAAFLAVLAAFVLWLIDNVLTNLNRLGVGTSFGFLDQPAGFGIPDSGFRPSQSLGDAVLVGVKNTAVVSAAGILLALALGILVGVARLSSNWLVRKAAAAYVESLRNVPVLLIIFFWYFGILLQLPPIDRAVELSDLVVLSVRGLVVASPSAEAGIGLLGAFVAAGFVLAAVVWMWRTGRSRRTGDPHRRVLWGGGVVALVVAIGFAATGVPLALDRPDRQALGVSGGFRLAPEYAALLIALVLYTASHIAEVVRGSILAVPRGQTEASDALGFSGFQRLRFVVLPQAFRIAVPPLSNQFLNLVKNSSLGVAIAYPEVTRIVRIAISQRAPAPQSIALLMAIYLVFSLTIALIANLVNRRLTSKGRR
jgi:general L-amino acid transport system permease protein